MKTKHYLTLASAALGMAAATTAQAEDGYDAPAGWPSPVVEHPMTTVLVDRLEYASPDKGGMSWSGISRPGMAVISIAYTWKAKAKTSRAMAKMQNSSPSTCFIVV